RSLREAGVELVEKPVEDASGVAFICIADSGENAIVVAPGANERLRPDDLPPLDGVSHLLLQLETPLDSVTAWAARARAAGGAVTGSAESGEHAIGAAPGANERLRPDDLPPLGGVSHLLLQLETPLDSGTAWAARARAAGVAVVLNAAPAQALPPALLEAVDLLVVNEGELAMLAGDAGDLEAALRRLPVPRAIVTLGGEGCVARDGDAILRQPAFAVEVVDTTAAGDTFCGALVAALARGDALAQAMREASAA